MQLTETQLQELDERGFLIIPEAFSQEEVEVLRSPIQRLISEKHVEDGREIGTDKVRNLLSIHRRDDNFAKLVRHPRLVGPAQQILKDDQLYVQQAKVNLKPGFYGAAYEWHTDFATHHMRDGVEKPLALNLHVLLDDVTEFNGPLWFVPGSHKREIDYQKSLDGQSWDLWTVPEKTITELVHDHGLFSVHAPRGSMLIFGDSLLHVSPPNISPYSRWIFSLILNPISNAATKKAAEGAHEWSREPVAALEDNCLLS